MNRIDWKDNPGTCIRRDEVFECSDSELIKGWLDAGYVDAVVVRKTKTPHTEEKHIEDKTTEDKPIEDVTPTKTTTKKM